MPPQDKPENYGPIQIQGRQLRCMVCGHEVFWEHEIQLATPLFSFREVGAECAICERCGYVHMFIPPSTFKDPDITQDGLTPEGAA